MIDSTLEQADLEDETKSDLHTLRKELEKSIATDTHLSLGVAANPLLENSMIDMNGGSVVSGVDREPAVVVDSYGNQNPDAFPQAEITSKPRDTVIEEGPSLNPEGHEKTFHGKGDALKGSKVTKKFGRKYYGGEVISFDPETNWYKVVYDDGDQEELWWWELEPLLAQSGSQQGSGSSKRSRPSPVSEGEHKVKRAKKGEQNDGVKAVQEQEEVNNVSVTQLTFEEADVDTRKQGKKRGKKRRMDDNARAEKESKRASKAQEASTDSGNRRSLRSKSTESKSDVALDLGSKLIGRETRKDFDGTIYKGKIIGYDPQAKYYKICYEDGDEEELEWSELKPTLLDENSISSSNGHMESDLVKTGPVTRSREKAFGDGLSKRGDAQHMKELRLERKLQDEFGAVSAVSGPHHPALEAVRFATVNDAENLEFYAWGEVAKFNEKPSQLLAVRELPGSSFIVHLAASHHHLAALTAAGQVCVWRNQHDNIYTRCNEWEHIFDLDNKGIVLVDIAGLDLDRSLAGYAPNQEDQVPDPFYLVAVSHTGKDYILQGSQPQEPVRTYYLAETPHLSLEELLKLNDAPTDRLGRIVQVSVGTVEAPDEPPFVGYITDTDRVYIRSATKDFMEEVNHVGGFSGRPLKIQCGRAYHAIIMTDNGRAWTWGRAYHSGLNIPTSKLSSPLAVCQPAPAALAGRKVVDVGCYGESFIALTEDGEVHQWTHSVTNPFSVYDSAGISVWKLPGEDRLKKIALGAGISAGISGTGKLHTWRTFPGSIVTEKPESTPLARDEKSKDTTVNALGTRAIVKVLCVAGSLIAIGQKVPC